MLHERVIEKVVLVLYSLYLLTFTNGIISSKIGVNYGRLGNNLPSPYESIRYIRNMRAGRVKLYDANPEVLKLLSGTHIQVSIMVTNDLISSVASSQEQANQWVLENVLAYYPDTMIRYVLVGNEVLSYNDKKMWDDLVPAMRNIKTAIRAHNINNIKIGTPLAMDMLASSYPPSSGRFRPEVEHVMLPLLNFLNGTKGFFFLDVYPYFPWSSDPSSISLDFALFRNGNSSYQDPESRLVYTNLLDQMLDSVNFAMEKLGYNNIRMAIAETGWPNGGDIDEPGANVYNAAVYNRYVVQKITANPPIGTPARPGTIIPTFIFSLYNENRKTGRGTERNWGLLNSSGRPMYEIDLTGKHNSSSYHDTLPLPTNNTPYRGKLWCVVAEGVDNSDQLINAAQFACGQGNGTCDALQPEGECYQPFTPRDHANYAFSSNWAKFKNTGATCYFNGLAMQTTEDPSHDSCRFPSVIV
ncbi:glucosidase [Lithospermum erythrorhizon]|uniref:glucan endo-1,3-beta-D-glucosidase n=1 Tax=Lithospermum erythrorhizon TaxID=34254 RepID=A0AAV3RC99_LITER